MYMCVFVSGAEGVSVLTYIRYAVTHRELLHLACVQQIRRVRSFYGGGVHFKLERTSCQ